MPVYTYTTLDDPSANNNTQAFGINASGQIVGFYSQYVTADLSDDTSTHEDDSNCIAYRSSDATQA